MSPIVRLLTKAGPWFIKQLPKLWPLLLDAKNRERLMEAAQNLASNSPAKRLQAKADLTAEIANTIATGAASEHERAQAQAWAQRARNLGLRLAMPLPDRQAKRAHRRRVEAELGALQREMDRHLGGGGGAAGRVLDVPDATAE